MSDAAGSEKKSPGQMACEAFWAHLGTGPDGQPPSAAWGWAGSQGTRSAWMAAAQAAATPAAQRGATVSDCLFSIDDEMSEMRAGIELARELPMTADIRTVVDRYAPRLLKAVEAVLKVADDLEGPSIRNPPTKSQIAAAFREAIAAALAGEADG